MEKTCKLQAQARLRTPPVKTTPHNGKRRAFRGLPAPLGEGKTPAVPGIVARVRPRASKGITDLLLLSVSDGFRAVDPSKKTYSISGGLGVCTTQGLPGIRDERKDTPTPKRREAPHTHTANNRGKTPSGRITRESRSNRLVSRGESRSLSELTRQITPPTKNGHAPPSTKSRKSSQSVNHARVLAW